MRTLLPPVGSEVFRRFTQSSLNEIQQKQQIREEERKRTNAQVGLKYIENINSEEGGGCVTKAIIKELICCFLALIGIRGTPRASQWPGSWEATPIHLWWTTPWTSQCASRGHRSLLPVREGLFLPPSINTRMSLIHLSSKDIYLSISPFSLSLSVCRHSLC